MPINKDLLNHNRFSKIQSYDFYNHSIILELDSVLLNVNINFTNEESRLNVMRESPKAMQPL